MNITIRYESTKTEGEIYEIVIDTIDKAIQTVSVDKQKRRELMLDLKSFVARLENMESRSLSC